MDGHPRQNPAYRPATGKPCISRAFPFFETAENPQSGSVECGCRAGRGRAESVPCTRGPSTTPPRDSRSCATRNGAISALAGSRSPCRWPRPSFGRRWPCLLRRWRRRGCARCPGALPALDLVERLLTERDAYVIPEVLGHAARMATIESRRRLAASIRETLTLRFPDREPRQRHGGRARALPRRSTTTRSSSTRPAPWPASAGERLLGEPAPQPPPRRASCARLSTDPVGVHGKPGCGLSDRRGRRPLGFRAERSGSCDARSDEVLGKTRGIEGLDLRVERGEVFGYLGPNGAGKTTTIRLLLDLIRPTSGRAPSSGSRTPESLEVGGVRGTCPAS